MEACRTKGCPRSILDQLRRCLISVVGKLVRQPMARSLPRRRTLLDIEIHQPRLGRFLSDARRVAGWWEGFDQIPHLGRKESHALFYPIFGTPNI